MNIGILGYGTVGRNVHKLLGAVDGVSVKYVLEQPGKLTESFMTPDPELILSDPDIELIVDALPGIHPSYEYMKEALSHGKHVVSSNKAAICFGFTELHELAKENHVSLLYEASCGGGIPIIEEILRIGALDDISRVSGILNGTSNYMLWQMDKAGMSYEDALRDAQRLGYAEADPTADVSGFDVKNKIIILSSLAFDGYVEKDIPMIGIEAITKEMMDGLRAQQKAVKLMGIAVKEGDRYALAVTPVIVSSLSLEANVPLNFNIVSFEGNYVGEVKLYGQGAGGDPTADAVVRDILKVARGDAACYERHFTKTLAYDPSLLRGRCHVGDRVLEDAVLAEASAQAIREQVPFAFEFNA